MSQVDPIRRLNGFYTGVKVQNVPSYAEKGIHIHGASPRPAVREKLVMEHFSRGNCLSSRPS